MKKKVDLSIVILNYNTEVLLNNCLDSILKVRNEADFETIVVDNASSDNSIEIVKKKYPWAKLILSNSNLGYSAGNNLAKKIVKGKYVLFLNSDTLVNKTTLSESIKYMNDNKEVGAMSCKTLLPNGKLDKDTRRSFPTPWVALSHFMFLDRLFSGSKFFSKYWYGYISEDTEHEVDVLQGAYFFARKSILDQVGWFDESYFLNGEDIDLSWKIKKEGWKLMYYPKVSIIHLKKGTKKIAKRLSNEMSGVKAMELFYRNRMWDMYPLIVNYLVILGIRLMKLVRSLLHIFSL